MGWKILFPKVFITIFFINSNKLWLIPFESELSKRSYKCPSSSELEDIYFSFRCYGCTVNVIFSFFDSVCLWFWLSKCEIVIFVSSTEYEKKTFHTRWEHYFLQPHNKFKKISICTTLEIIFFDTMINRFLWKIVEHNIEMNTKIHQL